MSCDLWQCDSDVMPKKTLTPVFKIENKIKKREKKEIRSKGKSKETWVQTS